MVTRNLAAKGYVAIALIFTCVAGAVWLAVGSLSLVFWHSWVLGVVFICTGSITLFIAILVYLTTYERIRTGNLAAARAPCLFYGLLDLVFGFGVAGVFLLLAHSKISESSRPPPMNMAPAIDRTFTYDGPSVKRVVPGQESSIFQDVAAQATVPLEMPPQRSDIVKITLLGEKLAPGIEIRLDDYVETEPFKAYPTKTLTIRAEATAFKTSPQEIQTLVPSPGESSKHDFLVTPKQGYEGKQKLLFHISQEGIHLATLNADIEVKAEPRSILSEIETKFSAISKGLRREYEFGDLPAILAQHVTTDIISKLNSKDYEETRYLLILLMANQPPYRSRGIRAGEQDSTYAFGKACLQEVALEALKPLRLKFEYFRGANRVLEDRLERTFGYVKSFKDEKNFTWYYLTPRGTDEGLKGIENLLIAHYAGGQVSR